MTLPFENGARELVAKAIGSVYGVDINPFAVELAKVTLNIAKKIAFDERRATAADL